jgi:predicted metal-dependent phosphoesterase TrpH
LVVYELAEGSMATFGAFSVPGRWFRGNCHTHTLLSDGRSSPAQVAQAYRREGYDFLVLTDHGRAQETLSGLGGGRFLVINGIELHPPTLGRPRGEPHHIVGIGVERSPEREWVKKATAASVIRWIEREGGVPVYGHPRWSGHDLARMREGKRAFGVEVYNSVCEAMNGLGDSSVHFDQALSAGIRWRAFAVDDAHRLARDAFGGWIMVKSRELTKRAILDAIRKGHFYATHERRQRPRGLLARAEDHLARRRARPGAHRQARNAHSRPVRAQGTRRPLKIPAPRDRGRPRPQGLVQSHLARRAHRPVGRLI